MKSQSKQEVHEHLTKNGYQLTDTGTYFNPNQNVTGHSREIYVIDQDEDGNYYHSLQSMQRVFKLSQLTPSDLRMIRIRAGCSNYNQIGRLLRQTSPRTWENWETGHRPYNPDIVELVLLKSGQNYEA